MHSAVLVLPNSFMFALKWLVPALTMDVICSCSGCQCLVHKPKLRRRISYLGQAVLAGEARAAVTLHETSSAVAIGIDSGTNPHIATGLLHDHAEDDALVDAELCALFHGVPDAANILASVAGLEHLRLVDVEDLFEGLPLVHARELGGGTGEVLETHLEK